MRNVALAAKLAAVLYLLFSFLDFLAHRDLALKFLALRILCAFIVLVISYLAGKKWARRRYRLFATLVPLTAAFFISIMIFMIKEPDTAYYAGLNLCIVGTGTLFQWTSREAMITSLLVFIMYLMSVIPHFGNYPLHEAFTLIAGNLLFIISTAFLVIVGAYNHNNFRYEAFIAVIRFRRNQSDLEQKNKTLKSTLATLRETEKQLYQSEKMSFLGQLSAGVIHEIANPLNYTNHALFILNKRVSAGNHDISEVITDMQEGLDRMRDIVSDLREFSHTGSTIGDTLHVHELVQSSLRILNKPVTESQTEVIIDIDHGLKVVGVKNQIIQVFSNLIMNAVQAMEETEEPLLRISAKNEPEGFVSVLIADNGAGIDDGQKSQLFDPFYTTKDPGTGTGLGLSICFRMVEAHGGNIDVSSKLKEGTTFTVQLPTIE